MKKRRKKSKNSNASLIIGGLALVVLAVVLLYPRAQFATAGGGSCATGFSAVGSTCVEYLTSVTNSSVAIPSGWNNTNNTVEVIGAGGGGGGGTDGYAGGGGAYSLSTNVSISGVTVGYKVGSKGNGGSSTGSNGGDTYLCSSTTSCTDSGSWGANVVAGAKGGSGGTIRAGGAGGASSSGKSTGTGGAKYSGGAGSASVAGTGGGAAGPNGAGFTGDNGGNGDNGFGGAGGSGGSAGSAGQEYDSSHGSGGGGGGNFGSAGAGGNYGAGGGGNYSGTGAAGAQGLIVLTYTPTVSVTKPTVTTNTPPSSITSSSAALDGQITATGGANATQSGFALGTDSTLSNKNIIGTSTLGPQTGTASFEDDSLATSLSPSTTYYYRAYADNTASGGGIGYGTIQNFTTSAAAAPTTVTPQNFTVAQNDLEVVDLSNSPSGTGYLFECPSTADTSGNPGDPNDCYYGTDGNQYVDYQYESEDDPYDFTMSNTGSYFFALYSYEGSTLVPIAESDIVTVTGSGSSASVSASPSNPAVTDTESVTLTNSPSGFGNLLVECLGGATTGGSGDSTDCWYGGNNDGFESGINDGTYPFTFNSAGQYFFALYTWGGQSFLFDAASPDVTVTGGSSGGYTVGTPGSQDMLIRHAVAMPGSIGGAGGGFTVSPSRVRKGSNTPVQFSWSMQNEQSCGIAGSDGSTPLANTGSGMLINGIAATTGGNYTQPYSVSINAPTTYTLTCSDGTNNQSVEVQINLVPSYQEI